MIVGGRASGGDKLTFAGDAVFQVGFEHPDWLNGFDHAPRKRPACASLSCGSRRPTASRWWEY